MAEQPTDNTLRLQIEWYQAHILKQALRTGTFISAKLPTQAYDAARDLGHWGNRALYAKSLLEARRARPAHRPGRVTRSDRLVTVFCDQTTLRIQRRGKRYDSLRCLTRQEVREYVENGSINAVKLIREGRGVSLAVALALLNTERYYSPADTKSGLLYPKLMK